MDEGPTPLCLLRSGTVDTETTAVSEEKLTREKGPKESVSSTSRQGGLTVRGMDRASGRGFERASVAVGKERFKRSVTAARSCIVVPPRTGTRCFFRHGFRPFGFLIPSFLPFCGSTPCPSSPPFPSESPADASHG